MSEQSSRKTLWRRIQRGIEAQLPRKAARDVINRIRYKGHVVPQSDMTIYPAPREIAYAYARGPRLPRFRRHHSGCVIGGDWDLARRDIEQDIKLHSCRLHWEQGADWEETPIFRKLLAQINRGQRPDGCATAEELSERYRRLDALFDLVRSSGRLASMRDLPDYYRREHGATLVHVGRDGTLLRSGGGAHRFAIARILGLPEMPAQLGVVHREAVKRDLLRSLSRSRLHETVSDDH